MRRAVTAVALTLGVSAPAALQGQARPGVGPNPDTPRLLVAVFTSRDLPTGVQTADAIRTRVQNTANIKQLYVIPKTDITNYLESSGYKPDSSLGTSDLRELAKLLRADEVLAGTSTRTATGFRIEPRLMLARDPSLAQPLPAVEAGSPGDAARQIERSLQEARKQLADNRACENAIRDQQNDKAIAAARAGIAKHPSATIARLCLANAFQAKNQHDSVIMVTDEIRRLDPKNSAALRFAFTAYKARSDQENAVRALVSLLSLEPNNPGLQNTVIIELAQLGKPEIAIPIVDTLILQNPGDPALLRQKWLLLLNTAAADTGAVKAARFTQAVAAGEELVKVDTLVADSVYFSRQIAAATQSSTPARAVELASRAVQRFPNAAEFWFLRGNAERKAGQLQMADESLRRAITLDPKYPSAMLLLAQTNVELNRPDTVVAMVRRAVAAGEDAKTWGAFLLSPAQAAWKIADSTKKVVEYEKVLSLAQESDRLSPSATAKFFVGISSFSIAMDALQAAQKPKSCTLAKRAQEMFLLTQTNMPAGGSIDANTARTVLGYVGQYSPTADQMARQYCR